jgi:geranylgeranyl transferase type-2 subunit beta
VRGLIEELEFPTGGFRAATWDEAADVEYTFYGLGVLALLNGERRA